MWFKNLTIFRLPQNYALTAAELDAQLRKQAFQACASSELMSQGWAAPREHDLLVHAVDKQFLLRLDSDKKLLPASVINQVTRARALEMEEQQGFALGRKAMKDLKERIADELLPRAFSVQTSTAVWLDPINGWLAIDTGSASKADEIIKMLLKAIDRFPIQNLRVKTSPQTAMTGWLAGNEAPLGFTIDQDADLRAHTEDKATVRYLRHTLNQDDIQRHIAAGKQCTKLALTWDDRISFVLTDTLVIKKVRPLDILDEESGNKGSCEAERFDADFTLMTGEIARMLSDLTFALDGEIAEQTDWVQEEAKSP